MTDPWRVQSINLLQHELDDLRELARIRGVHLNNAIRQALNLAPEELAHQNPRPAESRPQPVGQQG
ncbi:MAG TPA: hypothetical protein VK272_12065 [Solirubrobacteraceae bacterium]|nr:hypothetical protein [Solirubrobacteraceae bacterium]